ncbi:hypothetical protein B0A52_01606 [Exophiala mesophila]|uniref:Xylanolytic transcriptional activator regulatory domain-containing protein n=1 Tax=Exophiala mesophila TaxID=212818 RepID=A0A438NFI0_EXOME|nr:hypothetical protein B0A52_01606 [Exophiala mesophila]
MLINVPTIASSTTSFELVIIADAPKSVALVPSLAPGKPDSDAGSEPPTTPPMIQPEQTPGSPGLPREASSPAIASDEHEPKVPTTSILSSPKNARIILHPSDLTVHDHNPSVFTLTKDFIVPESTYVSPTFHVLDPYSYRLPSIADSREPPTPSTQPLAHCKYVVLQALAPFLDADFGSGLACDLLDTYFSSAYSTRMHPTCHHIHNFILRKDDILDPVRPRKTHPALLASMLFVASLSDKALGLFSGPEERDRVCKYLSLTTYRLLNPARYESLLSQEDLGLPPTYGSTAGWTNEDIRRALEPHQEPESFTLSGMDYVIALIHVSSVISGSEKKAASIRWWNVAFNLARDLKLNEEVECRPTNSDLTDYQTTYNCQCTAMVDFGQDVMTEVQREERRRTWWLLFLMDRHLALCYNRSLALLEAECKGLLLPMDDIAWQSNQQPHSHGVRADGPRCMLLPMGVGRAHGPPITYSGPGLFEWFLPLMVTTGHLLDYNRAKNNPVLAGSSMWSSQERRITRQIDLFQESMDQQLASFRNPLDDSSLEKDSSWSPSPAVLTDDSEASHFARTVNGYASHVVSVLRILMGSKWDPISLFEDADFWTSSPSFKDSMSHTMAAAEFVKKIISEDPDISFMPYFFGIQLLHGSLLLLLVAYRLQGDSGTAILDACEAVIRATEACFVTLPTGYQRQFRNVMRAAIGLAKGRRSVDTEKQLAFVLARYRWSRNGAGLAR